MTTRETRGEVLAHWDKCDCEFRDHFLCENFETEESYYGIKKTG